MENKTNYQLVLDRCIKKYRRQALFLGCCYTAAVRCVHLTAWNTYLTILR